MARSTIEKLRDRRLSTMSADERVEFYETLAAARLRLEGERRSRRARGRRADTALPRRSHVN